MDEEQQQQQQKEKQKKRVGRPRKYDWTDKRDICHQLYVEEGKSAAECQKYFEQHFDLPRADLPCRKSFLRQFALWRFPNHIRKLTPEEVAAASDRIHELWSQNMHQKDIKSTLASEGHQVKDYDFTKIWKKLGLRLRNDAGYKPPDPDKKKKNDSNKKKRKRSTGAAEATAGEADRQGRREAADATPVAEDADEYGLPLSAPRDPEQEARRQQRILELQLESDRKLATNKRRRRIRGFGHLPPDAPGRAPRYNSETSLDECKAILHLDNDMYQAVRRDFQTICENMNIIKKTKCVEGIWEGARRALLGENIHLSAIMHPLQPDQARKNTALDCLCQDVTKRMRVAGTQITVAEANNMIGINPTESKAIRRSLYEILAADHFESRLISGEDHFQALRQQWLDANDDRLRQALNAEDPRKVKAVELLCADAMKRFREDRNKRGERRVVQRNTLYGPGPGPAWAATAPRSRAGAEGRALREAGQPIPKPKRCEDLPTRFPSHISSGGSTLAQPAQQQPPLMIDPALPTAQVSPFVIEQPPQPLPAWFRLSPTSTLAAPHPKLWHGKVATATIKDLHAAATSKAGVAVVTKIMGIVKSSEEGGKDDGWQIDLDDELEVYLEAAGEKPTFVVVLDNGRAEGRN